MTKALAIAVVFLFSLVTGITAVWVAREGGQSWSSSLLIGVGTLLAAMAGLGTLTGPIFGNL